MSLKSKATAAPSAAAVATSRFPHGSGSEAAVIGCGSSSPLAPNLVGVSNGAATTTSIHPQSLPNAFDTSAIHVRRGYSVGPSSSHGVELMDSSMGLGISHGVRSSGGYSSISPPFRHHSSWDPTWDNNSHPTGGFMSLFNNQPHLSKNSYSVGNPSHYAPFKAPRSVDNGGSSSQAMEVLSEQQTIEVDSSTENVRTEKRIMWTPEEDERLMSAWLKNSTDAATGADRKNDHYWGDVIKSYNMTTPSQRKRNSKQAKDRWHKINRWTDLFECAYVKARRVFTSGYSDQMWIEAAHKFYVEDNKKAKLGPFVLMSVWKICRGEPKWKTYNEELRNARKRKSYHIDGEGDEHDNLEEEMPKRPIGQKAAKKATLATKEKYKGSSLDDDDAVGLFI
ncbi:hypothetical protein GUJ93_ZPchr0012g19058 [Zizania palustris]|uniref:Myb-like domain-containing protein n=1 Tax=Zizania palustris TaxID=103762 RepID=A0A8J6BSJ7_ZIZPA|nr:hypothetical protein GUJ93_ZPchr0012g19058 [Zizania palustris]KAG8094933.1 hypothetical protein GUJ93_ZPchr0012g19058 [Zizania palustris]